VKGDVNDNLFALVQLVPISKNVQVVPILRHKISIHTNKKRKQKVWIQKDEYSIEMEK